MMIIFSNLVKYSLVLFVILLFFLAPVAALSAGVPVVVKPHPHQAPPNALTSTPPISKTPLNTNFGNQQTVTFSPNVPPYAALSASFTALPLTGSVPLTVSFSDTSTGNPTSWKWTFGDGQSSTKKNPVITYKTAGTYTVRLTVKNKGVTSVATRQNYVTVSSSSPGPGPSNLMNVSYINVGQGDSILFQNGESSMLIDAGPKEAGKTVVNYIRSQKISKLTYILASHPHDDHIGGMVEVLNSFKPGTYIDNGETTTTQTYKNLINTWLPVKPPIQL
jgi:PKD repeat protein